MYHLHGKRRRQRKRRPDWINAAGRASVTILFEDGFFPDSAWLLPLLSLPRKSSTSSACRRCCRC
ncbi:MAG: hypothetical protein MZV64_36115 [Ignavibacteriales bacterium]|nr:hypothetical protein [Ignavibacteriales bacterium]